MNATFILCAMTSSNPFRTGYRSSIMPLIYGPRRISTIGILLASTTSSTVLVLSNLSSCYCLPEGHNSQNFCIKEDFKGGCTVTTRIGEASIKITHIEDCTKNSVHVWNPRSELLFQILVNVISKYLSRNRS